MSPDAVDLARTGNLDQAKAVQSVYRASVVDNYEKGYDYVQVHRLAEASADWYAYSNYGAILGGDGTPYGRFTESWSLLPTRPDALGWGLMVAGTVGDIATGLGAIAVAAVPAAGLPAFRMIKGFNGFVDWAGLGYAVYQYAWTHEGSPGDVVLAAASFWDGCSAGVFLLHVGFMMADGAGIAVYYEP